MDSSNSTQKDYFGLTLRNPIGIMCGFDKNARRYNLPSFRQFGLVEIGPILPGTANIKPVIRRIQAHPAKPLLFANLMHSPSSQDEESITNDYANSFSLIYDFADAFCINTSCSSGSGSKPLHDISLLSSVLDNLLNLRLCYDDYKPIIVKISPDTAEGVLTDILNYCRASSIDAVCVTNGSGTAQTVLKINTLTDGRLPIIAESASDDDASFARLFQNGACIVETGFKLFRIGRLFINNKRKNISNI